MSGGTLAARLSAPSTSGRLWRGLVIAAAAIAALYAVTVVHATGQTALAITLLIVSALAIWTYSSKHTGALRYLFPGVAAALVFVVFPMLYTMGVGFTNHSSTNLLDLDRARAYLAEESIIVPGSERGFTLHADGERWRVQLAGGSTTAALELSPDAPKTQVAAHTPVRPEPVEGPVHPERVEGTEPVEGPVRTPPAASMREIVRLLPALHLLTLRTPEGSDYSLTSLREFAQRQPLYQSQADGALTDRISGKAYRADMQQGFFTSADGDRLQPGFRVVVGLAHYAKVFSEGKFREPFASVFLWTVVFAALSVIGAAALGLLLASLLAWDRLRGRAVYRIVLFLPYAVPGFLSILVFKGLFNQNLGEVNLILNALFGIRPAWFSEPLLARTMLLIVNIWLGFPYMMVLCSGLVQSIPADLREASSIAGAGPIAHFRRITLPLIAKPLMPLLISAFAFNFNNFVLVSLLTGGRPDQVDATLPAGTTAILVSYTWRIAFQDSGQQYGLAAAISTVIFLLVAAVTLIQLRFTRADAKA